MSGVYLEKPSYDFLFFMLSWHMFGLVVLVVGMLLSFRLLSMYSPFRCVSKTSTLADMVRQKRPQTKQRGPAKPRRPSFSTSRCQTLKTSDGNLAFENMPLWV
jgi:hypothetical protein